MGSPRRALKTGAFVENLFVPLPYLQSDIVDGVVLREHHIYCSKKEIVAYKVSTGEVSGIDLSDNLEGDRITCIGADKCNCLVGTSRGRLFWITYKPTWVVNPIRPGLSTNGVITGMRHDHGIFVMWQRDMVHVLTIAKDQRTKLSTPFTPVKGMSVQQARCVKHDGQLDVVWAGICDAGDRTTRQNDVAHAGRVLVPWTATPKATELPLPPVLKGPRKIQDISSRGEILFEVGDSDRIIIHGISGIVRGGSFSHDLEQNDGVHCRLFHLPGGRMLEFVVSEKYPAVDVTACWSETEPEYPWRSFSHFKMHGWQDMFLFHGLAVGPSGVVFFLNSKGLNSRSFDSEDFNSEDSMSCSEELSEEQEFTTFYPGAYFVRWTNDLSSHLRRNTIHWYNGNEGWSLCRASETKRKCAKCHETIQKGTLVVDHGHEQKYHHECCPSATGQDCSCCQDVCGETAACEVDVLSGDFLQVPQFQPFTDLLGQLPEWMGEPLMTNLLPHPADIKKSYNVDLLRERVLEDRVQ